MPLHVFSVKKDGSYHEVQANVDSLLKGNGAYLIVDWKPRKIWIYRKEGISSSLAYAAGRAATNLNTRRGSKYQIVNIEFEEQENMLQNIFADIDTGDLKAATKPIVEEKFVSTTTVEKDSAESTKRVLVSGENIKYTSPSIDKKIQKTSISHESPDSVVEKATSISPSEVNEITIDPTIKALASQILFESNLSHLRTTNKPPKDQLRKELIKKLDTLLDFIYSS